MADSSFKMIRVFVASPSDVKKERDAIKLVVEELNRTIGRELGMRLECLQWEDHVAPLMGRPEEVILEQIGLNQWDIFIGVLWLRFGTPTGGINTTSGEPYLSGTEEEFTLAYQSWKEKGKPQILMYQCTKPPNSMADINVDQLSRLSSFFNRFRHDKEHPGLIRSYQELNDFERRVREDLIYALRQVTPAQTINYGPNLNPYHQSYGFLRLFLPSDNRERNDRKSEALQAAHDIRLIAYTGNSYLGLVSHRFRDVLEERLSLGGTFRVILNNPWTLSRFFIALADVQRSKERDADSETPLVGSINPILLIEQTVGFSTSFKDILDGYQFLRDKYGEQVEVRFTKDIIPSTVLLTELECFFEPYLHNDFQERMHKRLASFELQLTQSALMYTYLSDLFEFMWGRAENHTSFMNNQERYKEELIAQLKQHNPSSEA
jgi:hypothetical protein